MEKEILLIDGNSLFFKAFYGTYFRLKQGYERGENNEPVNALRLFSLMMINLRKNHSKYKIVIAFDEQNAKTHRHEYDFYKANRSKQPDELYEQILMVKEFLELYGIKWISSNKYEADDLIGMVAEKSKNEHYKVKIITADKDLLQLVDKNVEVYISVVGVSQFEIFTNDNFSDKFHNLSPMQIPDFKGIAGDSSDNLKGISGIGEKGAITLLHKYDSLEYVIENAYDESISKSTQEKIIKNQEEALLSKELAKIIINGDFSINLDDYILKPIKKEELMKYLKNKKVFNVIKKMNEVD